MIFHLQGCNSAKAESPIPSMEYEVIHESDYNEYADTTNKSTIVLSSQYEYQNELLKRTSEASKTINFETETVLLIDMGTQNSGGYSMSTELIDKGDYINANITYVFPGDSCSTDQAITNPFKFIKVNSKQYIIVTEELTYSSC